MITRQTAEGYIEHLRRAAEQINEGSYAYIVRRIEVFGSYLTNKQKLGDLDVLVTLVQRSANYDEHHRQCQARIALAYKHGRSFQNATESVYWPTEEVHRHLRGGKRGISIHDAWERSQLTAEYQTIFEDMTP